MSSVEKEVDRVLTLLRNKIRERGYTQLEVQEKLSWGRSYISQLLTKQKSLRVEQVLLILETIQIEPKDFYAELYQYPRSEPRLRQFDEYADLPLGDPVFGPALLADEYAEAFAGSEDFFSNYRQLRAMVRGLVQILVEKDAVTLEEVIASAKAVDPDFGPMG